MALSRKRKTKDPCPTCFLHRDLCICELIPLLELRTRICLVVHARELKRTTNTGRLAVKALLGSEMRIRGEGRTKLDLSDLLSPEYRTCLFFPSDDAIRLTQEWVSESPLPIRLIVPDGNWRQASKVQTRHPELKNIPRVMITEANPETQFLRAESTLEGMATLQAIAVALSVIEGAEVGESLMRLYRAKLERTLMGRGTFASLTL